jgi:hypothetical protein
MSHIDFATMDTSRPHPQIVIVPQHIIDALPELPRFRRRSHVTLPTMPTHGQGLGPSVAAPRRTSLSAAQERGVQDLVHEPTPTPTPTLVTWPASEIPVEIFEIITSYLSRAEVKTLRRVCREFESKVSARYFKNVVVPFRSELYRLSRDEFGARQHPSSALFSNGMRIFESFGPHILRFALSLEIDEDALAWPPIKPTQEAVPSFWGVYRWPHQNYNRYSDLEGIEQTADETEGMKEALRCLTKVTNLGLCCDAGLGFLIHPDSIARNIKIQHPVFATQDWRREQRANRAFNEDDDIVTIADFNGLTAPRRKSADGDTSLLKHTILEKMVLGAGFQKSQVEEAIDLLLTSEGTDFRGLDVEEKSSSLVRIDGIRNLQVPLREGDANDTQWRNFGSTEVDDRSDNRRWPLAPASLTRAQKELLLELEWAHRAMIQSYVIAMIDNASIGCFNNLTTFTIAKIPSSHIHILNRDDFWSSFPSLTTLFLGVIPDWRRISKPAPGCIEDESVAPLDAVAKVFKLLQNHVGKQSSIESVHFEWICGGEFAPSSFQRNQFVVPAPFLEDPDGMVALAGARAPELLLSLPHVKHLSLKNCWATPHVMLQTIRQMAMSSLEKLEFETVSLSGQPTTTIQIPLGQQLLNIPAGFNLPHNLNHMVVNNGFIGLPPQHQIAPLANGAANEPIPLPQVPELPPPSHIPDRLLQPDWLSWTGFIEHFSPGTTIRRILGDDEIDGQSAQQLWADKLISIAAFLPKAGRLIADEKRYKLKCLSFKTCGYVSVDAAHINTRVLLPVGAQGITVPANHLLLPARIMQRCKDKLLGQILLRGRRGFRQQYRSKMGSLLESTPTITRAVS